MIGPKARVELLLLLGLLALGLVLRHPGLLILAIPVVWHLVVGFALVPFGFENALSIQRRVFPRRLEEGGVVKIAVELRNTGKRPLSLVVQDGPYKGFSLVSGKNWLEATLRPGEAISLEYEAKPARGLYRLEKVAVEIHDPLHLAPRRLELPCPSEVLVLPRYEDISRLEILARRTLPMPGTARARRGGAGLEFYGVREYRPGDAVRRLAWKIWARRDEPAIVEFEEERATEVAVILDVRARAYWGTAPELFECAVRAAAALAQYYLRQGHRVALLKYGAVLDWVFPGYGRQHGERILRELAEAELGESEVFAELDNIPTRLLPAGSLLLFVSPLIFGDEEALGKLVARGYRVLVVLPDPISSELKDVEGTGEGEIAEKILTLERWVLLRRLRRSGVMVAVWDVRRPLAPLLRKFRPVLSLWR